jgi:hypothetical protein
MRSKSFILFNLLSITVFLVILFNIVGQLLESFIITTRTITLLLILLFCLIGILLQFNLVNKKLSENNKKAWFQAFLYWNII